MWEKIQRWWWFRINNPVIRKGEKGGFKWVFRRFWLEISTVSGNFQAKFMANEHPYAYLLAGKDDLNILGFCQMVYLLGHTITTDQELAKAVQEALVEHDKRITAEIKVEEDETEEKIALETEKAIQEHVELPKKERKKVERDINGRFRKAVKDASAQNLKGE